MSPGSTPLRRAFTLLELLVVISIVAVLAGLLLPVVAMVRRMANDFRCGSNLQQIGSAIEVYKGDNDDAFPNRLYRDPTVLGAATLQDHLFYGGGPLRGLTKILVCPRDGQTGKDRLMGRPRPGTTPVNWDDLSSIYTQGSSYDYEVSGDIDVPTSWVSSFFKDLPPASRPARATWAESKHNQKVAGNLRDGATDLNDHRSWGESFSGSLFPIIRCYFHYKWQGLPAEKQLRKVKNVSWDLNVFESTPYWEHDANVRIPTP